MTLYDPLIKYIELFSLAILIALDNEILSLEIKQDIKPDLDYSLVGAYPNPFNPKINFSFEIYSPGIVGLNIYDLSGRKIKTINKSFYNVGTNQVSWNAEDENGNNVASGAYIFDLVYDQKNIRGKVVYIK